MNRIVVLVSLITFASGLAQARDFSCAVKRIQIVSADPERANSNAGKDSKVNRNLEYTPIVLGTCTVHVDANAVVEKLLASNQIKSQREVALGLVKHDCGAILPNQFVLYDQGIQPKLATKLVLENLLSVYSRSGVIDIKTEKVETARWYAGGRGEQIVSFFEFFDINNTSLGLLFSPIGNPQMMLQGCFSDDENSQKLFGNQSNLRWSN